MHLQILESLHKILFSDIALFSDIFFGRRATIFILITLYFCSILKYFFCLISYAANLVLNKWLFSFLVDILIFLGGEVLEKSFLCYDKVSLNFYSYYCCFRQSWLLSFLKVPFSWELLLGVLGCSLVAGSPYTYFFPYLLSTLFTLTDQVKLLVFPAARKEWEVSVPVEQWWEIFILLLRTLCASTSSQPECYPWASRQRRTSASVWFSPSSSWAKAGPPSIPSSQHTHTHAHRSKNSSSLGETKGFLDQPLWDRSPRPCPRLLPLTGSHLLRGNKVLKLFCHPEIPASFSALKR